MPAVLVPAEEEVVASVERQARQSEQLSRLESKSKSLRPANKVTQVVHSDFSHVNWRSPSPSKS